MGENQKREKMEEKISVVILCGGKSTRMGQDKAELCLNGKTFLSRLEENLEQADEILLSVQEKTDHPESKRKHVPDQFQGCGPLAGVHAAMEYCKNAVLFVVSCDSPFVDFEIAKKLLPYLTEHVDAVIPVDQSGKKHVLCALYRREIRSLIGKHLKAGDFKVQHVLDEIRVCYVAVERLTDEDYKFLNINTPQEYMRMIEQKKMIEHRKKNEIKIPIYSIVAYSGTGKTTFLEKLIPELKKRGLRVAVVKHDAHAFEIDREGKDSYRMTKAGAYVTGLISSEKAVLMENRPVDFEQMVRKIENVDVILTEGYKYGKWPKIMLYREAAGKPFAVDPKECMAVVSDVDIPGCTKRYHLDDAKGVAEFLVRRIRSLT